MYISEDQITPNPYDVHLGKDIRKVKSAKTTPEIKENLGSLDVFLNEKKVISIQKARNPPLISSTTQASQRKNKKHRMKSVTGRVLYTETYESPGERVSIYSLESPSELRYSFSNEFANFEDITISSLDFSQLAGLSNYFTLFRYTQKQLLQTIADLEFAVSTQFYSLQKELEAKEDLALEQERLRLEISKMLSSLTKVQNAGKLYRRRIEK